MPKASFVTKVAIKISITLAIVMVLSHHQSAAQAMDCGPTLYKTSYALRDLSGCDFRNRDLSGIDFRDSILRGVNFAGANLSRANLNHSDLTGANLVEANLNYAILDYADLTSVNLSRTNLADADLKYSKSSDIVGQPTNLSIGWLLMNGYLLGWGAQLNGANLQGLDLSGADLSFSTLKGSNLTNTILGGAVLDYVASGSILGKVSSLPYGWKQVNGYLVGRGAQLDGADLSGSDLTSIDLSFASLTKSNLSNVIIKNANLTGSNLEDADLAGAILSNVTIAGSNMTGVKLDGTHSDGLIYDHVPYPQEYLHTNLKFTIPRSGCRVTGDFGNPSHGIFLDNCGPALPANCAVLAGYLLCHGVNLDGDDLTEIAKGLSLSQHSPVDLTRASMNGVNVTGANLSLFNLYGVKSAGITGIPDSLPKGWILASGYLIGQGVDLSGYDLSNASLAGVASGEISGSPKSLPSGWALQNGYLIGPGADLSGANLSGISLDNVSLSGAVLDGVRSGGVSGSPLSLPTGWALRNGYLLGPKANVQNADLSQANLQGVSSGGLSGDPKSLPSGWYLIRGYLIGPGADLSGADLSGLSLDGFSLDLSLANLSRANLSWVNLNNVNLSNANLNGVLSGQILGKPLSLPTGWVLANGYLAGPGANLVGAHLGGSLLYYSDLSGTNLSGADLTGANLAHVRSGGIVGSPIALPTGWILRSGYLFGSTSDLSQCDLSGLQMDGIDLSKATLKGVKSGNDSGSPMQLPPNWRLIGGFLVGPGANLTGSSFTATSFQGVSLTGTNLSGSSLGSVNLANVLSGNIQGTPANLPPQWSLVNGYLIGPNADLNFAQLNGANLSNQNLTGVTLGNADLSGVTSGGITGMPTSLPVGWTVSGGYLIGPTANLSNANLSGVSLTGSNLGGATLAGANLKGVISGGISGLPSSLPSGWALSNGYLFGSGTNLSNANLTGMNLSGLDLNGATLAGAQLAGVNMTNTKIAGADLTGAYVGSQVWWLPKGWSVLNGTVKRTYSKTPPPKMVGQLATGKTVNCSASLWAPSAFVTYQWLLDGKKIAGATSVSFRISTAQKGHKLSVTIVESAAGYISASATSSAVKIG